jgi:hypothetical protein
VLGLGLAGGAAVVFTTASQDRTHQEAMAPRHLRGLAERQAHFREQDEEGDGELDYARDIEELGFGYMADEYNGYRFEVRQGPNPAFEWAAEAIPTQSRSLGGLLPYRRHYYIDQTGVVRVELDRRATADSSPLAPAD